MFKKIFCILFSLLIICSVSLVSVSADDTSSNDDINYWTYEDFKNYFSQSDLAKMPDINFMLEHQNYNFIFNGSNSGTTSSPVFDYSVYTFDGEAYYDSSKAGGNTIIPTSSIYFCSKSSSGNFSSLSVYKDTYYNIYYYPITIGSYFTIFSDLDTYNSFLDMKGSDFDSSNVYYCADLVNEYLKFYITLDGSFIDVNSILAPTGYTNTAIKYSNSMDCPYSKYSMKVYENDEDNYTTAGLFSDLELYYTSSNNFGSVYDHSENIDFFIPLTNKYTNIILDDYKDFFDKELYEYYENGLPDLNPFFNSHFQSIHYYVDDYSVLDFFNMANGTNSTTINDFVSLVKYGECYYFKFSLKSEFTITHTGVGVEPDSSNLTNSQTIFTGTKITHTCCYVDLVSGDISASTGGLGSDLSQADDDLSRPPTIKELEELGFEYGYPNTSGSYPYKVTIYRNGKEYFQMYFSKMPSVSSTYYTDKCIDYGLNLSDMKGYMYFKEQHMSKEFDFTARDVFPELHENGSAYDMIIYEPVTEIMERILDTLLCVDTSEFSNTYTLHFWTNYTGDYPDNYNGFYCKFNWDLEASGHFQKNNSDDDYNYSQDYEVDEGFTDNNGNIHGGAVEIPTEPPSYSGFNNGDFSFDENSLWNYADSFLVFCGKAFKILPSFIWQLIACSMVVVIILRIVGR